MPRTFPNCQEKPYWNRSLPRSVFAEDTPDETPRMLHPVKEDAAMHSDIIITSEHVFAGVEGCDEARAAAVCIKDGRIQAVVDPAEADAYRGPDTRTVDYGSAFVCPGLHDAHLHAFHSALYSSPLAESFLGESEADCVARLAPLAERRPTGWLLAQGWREYRWKTPVMPSKHSLDEVYPDRPVALYSGDAHTLWLNSCALAELGVTRDSVPPVGGSYDKDDEGELTGIVREAAAMELMPRIVASFTLDEIADAYRGFLRRLASHGITSVCDVSLMAQPGLDFVRDDVYAALEEAGDLTVRVHLFPTLLDDMGRFERMRETYRGPLLNVGGFKQFFDGVSSQHTAYLQAPYTNARFEGDRGQTTVPFATMRDLIMKAAEKGYPVRIHTIGDEAIHEALDIFEEALETYGAPRFGRNSLEHLENFQPNDIERLARLGVIASVQPPHITLDPGGPERDLGPMRCQYMWPFATLLADGATLALGTDSPVVDVDSRGVLYTAVTRQDATTHAPQGGWLPSEKIGMADALRAYAAGSAAAANDPDIGTLEAGKWADIAVFDLDLLGEDAAREPERILDMNMLATYVAGRAVYEA